MDILLKLSTPMKEQECKSGVMKQSEITQTFSENLNL